MWWEDGEMEGYDRDYPYMGYMGGEDGFYGCSNYSSYPRHSSFLDKSKSASSFSSPSSSFSSTFYLYQSDVNSGKEFSAAVSPRERDRERLKKEKLEADEAARQRAREKEDEYWKQRALEREQEEKAKTKFRAATVSASVSADAETESAKAAFDQYQVVKWDDKKREKNRNEKNRNEKEECHCSCCHETTCACWHWAFLVNLMPCQCAFCLLNYKQCGCDSCAFGGPFDIRSVPEKRTPLASTAAPIATHAKKLPYNLPAKTMETVNQATDNSKQELYNELYHLEQLSDTPLDDETQFGLGCD